MVCIVKLRMPTLRRLPYLFARTSQSPLCDSTPVSCPLKSPVRRPSWGFCALDAQAVRRAKRQVNQQVRTRGERSGFFSTKVSCFCVSSVFPPCLFTSSAVAGHKYGCFQLNLRVLRSLYKILLRERLSGERNSIFSFGEAFDLASPRPNVDFVAVILYLFGSCVVRHVHNCCVGIGLKTVAIDGW